MDDNHSLIEKMYRRHFQELLRFQTGRVSCRELAADLIQELFLRLLSRERTMTGVQHHRGFLFSAARNMAAEAHRSSHWQPSGTPDEDEVNFEALQDPKPTQEAMASHRQSIEQLLKALEELPPRCREIFVLHRFEGHSYPEIAERFGISVSAVEKHMMRALHCCHTHLSRIGD